MPIPERPVYTEKWGKVPPRQAETWEQRAAFKTACELYRKNSGPSREIGEAVALMQWAAQLGSIDALAYMGIFTIAGLVVEEDETKGWEYIRRAESMGYTPVLPAVLEIDRSLEHDYRMYLEHHNEILAKTDDRDTLPKDSNLRQYELEARQKAESVLLPGGRCASLTDIQTYFDKLKTEYDKLSKRSGSVKRYWMVSLELAWLYWLMPLNGIMPPGIKKPERLLSDYHQSHSAFGFPCPGDYDMRELWNIRILAAEKTFQLKNLYDSYLQEVTTATESKKQENFEKRKQKLYESMIYTAKTLRMKWNEVLEQAIEQEKQAAEQEKIRSFREYEFQKLERHRQGVQQAEDDAAAMELWMKTLEALYKAEGARRPDKDKWKKQLEEQEKHYLEDFNRQMSALLQGKGGAISYMEPSETVRRSFAELSKRAWQQIMKENREGAKEHLRNAMELADTRLLKAIDRGIASAFKLGTCTWARIWSYECGLLAMKRGGYFGSEIFSIWAEGDVCLPGEGEDVVIPAREVAAQVGHELFVHYPPANMNDYISWGQYSEPDALLAREYIVKGFLGSRELPDSMVASIRLADTELFSVKYPETVQTFRDGYRLEIEGENFPGAVQHYKAAAYQGYVPAMWRLFNLLKLVDMSKMDISKADWNRWGDLQRALREDIPRMRAMAIQGDFKAWEYVVEETKDPEEEKLLRECENYLQFRDPEYRSNTPKKLFYEVIYAKGKTSQESLEKMLKIYERNKYEIARAGISNRSIQERVRDLEFSMHLEAMQQAEIERISRMAELLEEEENHRLEAEERAQEWARFQEQQNSRERAFNGLFSGRPVTDQDAWIQGAMSDDDYYVNRTLREERERKKQAELDKRYPNT